MPPLKSKVSCSAISVHLALLVVGVLTWSSHRWLSLALALLNHLLQLALLLFGQKSFHFGRSRRFADCLPGWSWAPRRCLRLRLVAVVEQHVGRLWSFVDLYDQGIHNLDGALFWSSWCTLATWWDLKCPKDVPSRNHLQVHFCPTSVRYTSIWCMEFHFSCSHGRVFHASKVLPENRSEEQWVRVPTCVISMGSQREKTHLENHPPTAIVEVKCWFAWQNSWEMAAGFWFWSSRGLPVAWMIQQSRSTLRKAVFISRYIQ